MQCQFRELRGNWERWKGDLVIQPAEIGISKERLVGLRSNLVELKDKLL